MVPIPIIIIPLRRRINQPMPGESVIKRWLIRNTKQKICLKTNENSCYLITKIVVVWVRNIKHLVSGKE